MKVEKFKVVCKKCGSGDIQTTLANDSGYSNWTVADNGFVEFKCSCGKFGSTDERKEEPANDLENFDVRCLNCDSREWKYEIGDIDGDVEKGTRIYCKCGQEEYTK